MNFGGYIMIRKSFLFLTIFTFLFLCYCGDSGSSNSNSQFIIKGTVYVDSQPHQGALVEFGVRLSTAGTFDANTKYTDSDGEYEFKTTLNPANLGRSRYRIRVQDPSILVWTDYREGAISIDEPRIQDFHF